MRGQWTGEYSARQEGFPEQAGQVTLNIDERPTMFRGVAFLRPKEVTPPLPQVGVAFSTPDKAPKFTLTTSDIWAVDPRTALPADWDSIKHLFPTGAQLAKSVTITANFEDTTAEVQSSSDLGVKFSAHLKRAPYTDKSSIVGRRLTWEEYKAAVAAEQGDRLLFRGQRKPWGLRTAFHRRQRYVIGDFMRQDVPVLARYFSARTNHIFDLSKDLEYAAFLSLAQHHGFPTPLLDWTYSPFVAAFFAFRHVEKNNFEDEVARIYIFDRTKWHDDWRMVNLLDVAFPFVTILDTLAIENPRMIPQQAVTMVANVDDLEGYVAQKATESMRRTDGAYLRALDIPWSERSNVMKELTYMGITAGAMFPGLDGVCEELRERFFDR